MILQFHKNKQAYKERQYLSNQVVCLPALKTNILFENILTDSYYATLTSPYIFQNTVEYKLPLLR